MKKEKKALLINLNLKVVSFFLTKFIKYIFGKIHDKLHR